MTSLQLNLEGYQLIFPAEGKGPHERKGYCRKHYFPLEVVAILIMVRPCCALSGFMFDTKQDEYKPSFIFPLGAGIYD